MRDFVLTYLDPALWLLLGGAVIIIYIILYYFILLYKYFRNTPKGGIS